MFNRSKQPVLYFAEFLSFHKTNIVNEVCVTVGVSIGSSVGNLGLSAYIAHTLQVYNFLKHLMYYNISI